MLLANLMQGRRQASAPTTTTQLQLEKEEKIILFSPPCVCSVRCIAALFGSTLSLPLPPLCDGKLGRVIIKLHNSQLFLALRLTLYIEMLVTRFYERLETVDIFFGFLATGFFYHFKSKADYQHEHCDVIT